jgi:hypothetical protein
MDSSSTGYPCLSGHTAKSGTVLAIRNFGPRVSLALNPGYGYDGYDGYGSQLLT